MAFKMKGYVFWTENRDSWSQKVIASSLEEAKKELVGEYKDHSVYDLFHVIVIREEGDKVLGSYWEEDEAEEVMDHYSESYPNAFIDIFYGDDF